MKVPFHLAASFCATIVAAFKCQQHVDKFDDPPNTLSGGVPAASPVTNTTSGPLYYEAFDYVLGALGSAVIKPPSGNYVIATGLATETLEGQPAWYAKPSGELACFDQSSIYFACGVDTEASTGVLTPCTIQLTGVKTSGRNVTQNLVYKPDLEKPTYEFAKFKRGFTGLTRIDVKVIKSDATITLTAPLFDNNVYRVCYKK